MLASRIGANGPSVETPPRWTIAWLPATTRSTAAPSCSAAVMTSSPSPAGAISATSLRRRTRASRRRRGRSSRPRPPAAPVRSRRSKTGDDAASFAGDRDGVGHRRDARRRLAGAPSAQALLQRWRRVIVQLAADALRRDDEPLALLPALAGAAPAQPRDSRGRFARRPDPRRPPRLRRQARDRVGADGRVRRQPHRHPRGAVQAAGSRAGADAPRRRHLRDPRRRRFGGVPDPPRPARDAARRGRHARVADRRRDRGRGAGGAAPNGRRPGRDATGTDRVHASRGSGSRRSGP